MWSSKKTGRAPGVAWENSHLVNHVGFTPDAVHDGLLDLLRNPIAQVWLATADLLQPFRAALLSVLLALRLAWLVDGPVRLPGSTESP